MDMLAPKNISYLKARDPSIVSANRPNFSYIKVNLIDEFGEATTQEQKEDENIRVYLRIKKGYDFGDLYEINGNTLTSKVPPGSNLLRNVKEGDSMRKVYTFSKIFEPDTTQCDIFNHVVKPKILDFINGQNSTLLTYGASGSGKTFTVLGTDEEPGIIPRSLEYLFRSLTQLAKNPSIKPLPTGEVTFLNDAELKREKLLCRSLLNSSTSATDRSHHIKTYRAMQQRLSSEPIAELEEFSDISIAVWVSFAEIYNEQIYDLLQFEPPRGQKRDKLRLGMSNGQTYIKNLTQVSVSSGEEAYQILKYGIHHLNYAPTQLNEHSSRSHSIFNIKLVQFSEGDKGKCISSFNFCDLAGSERSKKTHNVGDRMKESNNINSSLLVLGRCIGAVRNAQRQNDNKLVPFRESKLTQLFQRALAGYEDIAMIVNISPSREMFDESQHVLNFSAVAKDIVIERKPEPVLKKKSRFSMLVEEKGAQDVLDDYNVEEYQNIILLLQDQLESQRIEYETNQQMNLDYVRQGYEQLLKSMEEVTEREVQKIRDRTKLEYETKLELMRLKYERIIKELKEKSDVISIDSSSDEEEEKIETHTEKALRETKETLNEGIEEYKELQHKYRALESENCTLRARIAELEEELSGLYEMSPFF